MLGLFLLTIFVPLSLHLYMNIPLKINVDLPKFQEKLEKMTAISYEMLGKESSRLLRQQKELLGSALKVDDLFDKNRTDKQQTYNFKEVEESIREIDNEIHKLETLETVIAVVGTMKAGKSTTINAIVGKEILPNRNDPMTTLPTLIRNKHGQVEPLLTLNKIKPLTSLTEEISKTLTLIKTRDELTETNPSMYGTKDGKELIQMLMENQRYDFQDSYQGQEDIFRFLKHLNDVMRLAKELRLSVDAVYESYQESKDLPLIEVEFCHLQAMDKSANGNLSILDTPGPNEFGQSEALKTVFLHQLKRATSVMLVIDYTQMKSEAEEDVREQIESIKKQLDKERLSILVNKFDQANSNSMQKEDVQVYVASTLMNDPTLKCRVFPVSAWQAYLANRTLNYLEVEDEMPSVADGELSWVVDFGETALGRRWQKHIGDIEEVTESANDLWNDSFFQEPLDNVIKDSHTNAAKFCVTAAVAKLDRIQELFSNTVNIRHTALGKEILQIQQAIDILEQNIHSLEKLSDKVKDTVSDSIGCFKGAISALIEQYNKYLETEVNRVFKEGVGLATTELKRIEGKKIKEINDAGPGIRDSVALFLSAGKKNHQNTRIQKIKEKYQYKEIENGCIQFTREQDAQEFLKTMNEGFEIPVEDYEKSLNDTFKNNIETLSDEIENKINAQTQDALSAAKQRLGDSGFNLTLSSPAMKLNSERVNLGDLLYSEYKSTSVEKTGHRRQPGVWGGICKFFSSDDWGWESYQSTEEHHVVNVAKIHKNIKEKYTKISQQFEVSFEDYLTLKYQPEIDKYLAGLVSYLEGYKGVLIDGEQSQKNLEKYKAEVLKARLKNLKSHVITQNEDLKVINKALQEASSNAG